MQSDHTEPVLGGYRDPKVCGGPLAKTSQMPALASVWAHCTKSTRCTPPIGRTRVAYVYNGRRMVDRSMRISEQVCPPSRTGASRESQLSSPRAEKQLLETISFQIQRVKTDNIPCEPYTYPLPVPPPTAKPTKSKIATGKSTAVAQPSKAKSKPKPPQRVGCPLPSPPEPQPALKSRVSAHSPALPSGVLIDTVRAGMNAPDGQGAVGGIPGGKGKRKVVRVRG
jgi:hypothetical protein